MFNLASAFLAFLAWGSWAFIVNDSILAALVQGLISFTATLLVIQFLTWVFYLLPKGKLRKLLPSLITATTTGCISAFIHYLSHTDKIFYTILPSISMTFIFCLSVNYRLIKKADKR